MDIAIVIGLVGIAASLVGIPVTYRLARRTRQRPVIEWGIDFEVLMRPHATISRTQLSMEYAGRPIDMLSRTYVAVWNARGDTVRGGDVVPTDPLRVQLAAGDTVLQARAVWISRRPCGICIEIPCTDPAAVLLRFDFLDAGDGCILEILHNGTQQPSLAGTIRGASLRFKDEYDLDPAALSTITAGSFWQRFRTHFDMVTAVLVVMLLGGAGLMLFRSELFLRRSPTVVAVSQYDLNTLAGQSAFADRVSAVGLHSGMGSWPPRVMAVVAVLQAAVSIRLRMRRLLIPRSILGEFESDLPPPVSS